MSEYRIDSHKLMFHPHRVSDWLRGEPIYPVYVEICPYGGCNHRCVFCAYNYTQYKPISLDTGCLEQTIKNMGAVGVRAVMYAGEGEPLLHKDIAHIINHTKQSGMDVAVTTNGVMFTQEFSGRCLAALSWIKVSVDAGTPETYATLHGTRAKDFFTVLDNLETAVRVRSENHYDCAIGAQALLLPQNADQLRPLAEHLVQRGVDYLVVKPFTGHPYREGDAEDLEYSNILRGVEEALSSFDSEGFRVIVRADAFSRLEKRRQYGECHALDFWAFIDARGDVYACSNFLKNGDYVYGNIYEEPFEKIWNSRKRIEVDMSCCRSICRMDKINQYLWELKHPPKHINFI